MLLSRVYFALAGRTNRLKIGVSTNVERRILSLQGSNPTKLILLGTILGSPKTERAIHLDLDSRRISGEWFRYDWFVKEYIQTLLDREAANQTPKARFVPVVDRGLINNILDRYKRGGMPTISCAFDEYILYTQQRSNKSDE